MAEESSPPAISRSDSNVMTDMMNAAGEMDDAPEVLEPINRVPDAPPEPAPEPPKEPETPPSGEPIDGTPDTPQEPTPQQDEFLKDLESRKLRSDAHPRTTEQFSYVKEQAKTHYEKAKALEAELAQLKSEKEEREKQIPPPEREQEFNKYKEFYENYGITDDPAFGKEYQDRITQGETELMNLLSQSILPKSAQDYINSQGGPSQFMISEKLMPGNDPKFMNPNGTKMTHADYWRTYVEGNLRGKAKYDYDAITRGIWDVQREKQSKEQDVQQNRSQYIEQTKAQQQAAQKDWSDRAMARAQSYVDKLGDMAKIKAIPPDATPEIRRSAEAHNARIAKAKSIADSIAPMVMQSPETFAETVLDAARAHIQDDLIKEANDARDAAVKDAEGLRKELEAIKRSSSTVRKTVQPQVNKPFTPQKGQSAGDIMTQYMHEAKEL